MPDWKCLARERLAGLKLKGAREIEVAEELAQDMEERYNELLSSGVPEPEAKRRAREILEQSDLIGDELRRRDGRISEPAGPFSGLRQDLKLAFSNIRTRPAFSLMTMGMLALGIAGNAAVFSIFNSMFLRPLPFRDSGQLVDLDETAPKWHLEYVGGANPDFLAWRKQNSTFEAISAFDHPDFNLSGFGPAQRVHGAAVTIDMFKVLGLQPALGRNFTPQEDAPHGPKVVLLGYNLWQRLFHSDPGVIGRVVRLSNVPYTVIGVLPREAVFPDHVDLWVPLALEDNADNGWYLSGVGRMKPGVSIEQARADLLRIHKALILSGRKENEITFPIVQSLRSRYLGDLRTVSRVLLGAVGVVLLIACVNIAALMLVRATARTNEIAIRTALGASRSRIIRQLLTENLVMAALGGVVGVGLGYLLLRGLLALMPADEIPGWIVFGMDWRFVAFCFLITGGAAALFGLLPALQASRVDSSACLHESGARVSLSRGNRRTLSIMVAGEIGLAVMLVVSAALLLQAFRRVLDVDPGFRPQNVITFRVDLPESIYAKPEQRAAFFDSLLARLRSLPGVQTAGAATAPPLGGHWGNFFVAEGARPLGPHDENPVVLQVVATPGYFDAIGLALLAGRQFDARDNVIRVGPDGYTIAEGGGPLTIIANETFTKQYWPGESAVGKRVRHPYNKAPWMTVIGVTKDERHYGLDQPVRPQVYFPYGESTFSTMSIVVRGAADPQTLIGPARAALRSLDPDIPMYDVRTMTSRLNESMWARRAYSWLFTVFAAIALALAAAGLYGVISYAVSRRAREIGIRIAIGARPDQVVGMLLRNGMILVSIGVAGGLLATLAAVRPLRALLFSVSPRDPLIYIAVILGVAIVCLLANFIPARRAASLDPMRALRTE